MAPPPFLSVRVMQKAMTYEEQCRALGGLPAKLRRSLTARSRERTDSIAFAQSTTLQPGAHLVREWNGRSYHVEVLEDGYRMDGKAWTSLSALARHITGTNWSGPRFFGLTKKGQGAT